MKSVLIVEEDDERRRALCDAFAQQGVPFLDVQSIFPAMAAFGRADFGAVLAREGQKNKSVRGLCGMARRWHKDVRLFVVKRPGADDDMMRRALGDDVRIFDVEAPAGSLAGIVADALRTEPAAEAEPLVLDVEVGEEPPPAAAAGAQPAPARGDAAPSGAAGDAPLVIEGHLEGVEGPALLMGLFAQGLTGRLVVSGGPAAGTLYLYRGEPSWAEEPGGDAALFSLLVARGLLPPDAEVRPVPEGALLESLYAAGRLGVQDVQSLQRGLVRDRVVALAAQGEGTYRFVEDRALLEVKPPFTVNPFGLVLESLRRSMSPDRLLAFAAEIEGKYVAPAPALSSLSERVATFTRGLLASSIIDGTSTVGAFTARTGLDMLMGSLVVLTLLCSRMITLESAPRSRAGQVTLADAHPTA